PFALLPGPDPVAPALGGHAPGMVPLPAETGPNGAEPVLLGGSMAGVLPLNPGTGGAAPAVGGGNTPLTVQFASRPVPAAALAFGSEPPSGMFPFALLPGPNPVAPVFGGEGPDRFPFTPAPGPDAAALVFGGGHSPGTVPLAFGSDPAPGKFPLTPAP